jgi:anaerobic ribonucleoside-triphosphate reductase
MNRQELLQQHSDKRTKAIVYTRVMGYHRPVESFNTGKKGEHRQRCHFVEAPEHEVTLV